MFLNTRIQENQYQRKSKLGIDHAYVRRKTLAVFRCDNCDSIFERDLKNVSQKRLNNNYFHCCSNCNYRRFAQKKGADHKRIWDLPSDADLDISKL